jgi:hypothetical protein
MNPRSPSPAVSRPRRSLRRWSVFFAVPLAALALWAFAKPMRLWAPELHGMTCADAVCVEQTERLAEATALYAAALARIDARGTPLRERPRMTFCATDACYRAFGGGAERAINYPWVGSLIAPTSWAPHFVRHELIHALQGQQLGEIGMLRKPAWFREGMAYAWSEPPAEDMPDAFVPLRERFEAWVAGIDAQRLWIEAGEL